MDRDTFVQILGPLALEHGGLDAAQWAAYHRSLGDVPAQWLDAAVTAALRQDRRFMLKSGELRALAMAALGEAQKQIAPADCEACGNTRWLETPDSAGVPRAQRCECWDTYRAAIAALGAVQAPQRQLGEGEAFDARMARIGADA